MPPKRGKATSSKSKRPAEASTNNDATNKTLSDKVTDQSEDVANHETKPEDTSSAEVVAPADAQDEKQHDAKTVAHSTVAIDPATGPASEEHKDADEATVATSEPQAEIEADKKPKSTANGKVAKSNKRKATDASESDQEPEKSASSHAEGQPEAATAENPSKKSRKTSKVAREGERKSGRVAKKTSASEEQILNYLLSDAAADLCRPEDEAKDIELRGSDIKTYSSSVLSPFEELLCALVLSRPISHRLGLRTIRTILNDPYDFSSPESIINAGNVKTRQALEDAHTQHKDKTAEQISLIAEVVASKFAKDASDASLERVREDGNKDWDAERDLLQTSIKGLGKTGLDIFFRRTQWLWEESFPFVDERTARGVDKLGLPKNADELREVLEQNWAKLDTSTVAGADDAEKIRRAFVIICERATGGDLEEKSQALLEAAAAS